MGSLGAFRVDSSFALCESFVPMAISEYTHMRRQKMDRESCGKTMGAARRGI